MKKQDQHSTTNDTSSTFNFDDNQLNTPQFKPQLKSILEWLNNYFKLERPEIDKRILKRSLRNLMQASFGDQVQQKISNDEIKLALTYLDRLKEGKILLFINNAYLLLTFDGFDLHCKNNLIEFKISKALNQRNINRHLNFIMRRFNLCQNYVCLWKQRYEIGHKAIDHLEHSKNLMNEMKKLKIPSDDELRFEKTKTSFLYSLKDILSEINTKLLCQILTIIDNSYYEFDNKTYNDFFDEIVFARDHPILYQNDSKFNYTWLVSALIALPLKPLFVSNNKSHLLYQIYIVLLVRCKTASELTYFDFLSRFRLMYKQNIRSYHTYFMIRFNGIPICIEEVFLALLVPYQEHYFDFSEMLDFIRDVWDLKIPLETAKEKLIMLTNPALFGLCSKYFGYFYPLRLAIRKYIFPKFTSILFQDDLTSDDLLSALGETESHVKLCISNSQSIQLEKYY